MSLSPRRRAAARRFNVWLNRACLPCGRFLRLAAVMAAVGLGPFPFDRLYLTEWNGLRVPAGFDCDIFYQETEEGWTEEARRVMGMTTQAECAA